MNTTTFENKYAHYELTNSYLKIIYKGGKYIDYAAAQAIVKDRLRIQSYKSLNILCDITSVEDISTEARDYLATFGSALIKSVALISTGSTLKHMATYFVAINKPKIPTRVFDTMSEAEHYIQSL
ncbi:hypothetical protein H1R17_10110 [Flavobacterium sp. xlx-214]|uniref:STAS/SEC14 domain-containing protein n=1 Tax=unclassified Flavobacterium TaxID=196869 RepID=UPI0013D6E9D3|nr:MULTISPECIES: STAS/SEC14 domain-containing protein [unclassified Flavobacterium]MBA5791567.1 hypothetical protein [Flavobacterium sp. xlx-221]QMI82816.1 hypothetical protein H1R17_10110 [Flavobacterium sp. xlx-214]